MRDLQVALLRQDPWTATWPDEPTATTRRTGRPTEDLPATDPATPGEDVVGTGFVGREPQLAAAREAVARGIAGDVQWLVLTGPAGIGKTRLAEEVIALAAEAGYRAVRARCLEEEGAPAWWPVRQVVTALGADPDEAAAGGPRRRRRRGTLRGLRAGRRACCVPPARTSPSSSSSTTCSGPTRPPCARWATSPRPCAAAGCWSSRRSGTTEGGAGRPSHRRRAASASSTPGRSPYLPSVEDDVAELAAAVAGTPLDEDEAKLLADRTGGNALFVTRVRPALAGGARRAATYPWPCAASSGAVWSRSTPACSRCSGPRR